MDRRRLPGIQPLGQKSPILRPDVGYSVGYNKLGNEKGVS